MSYGSDRIDVPITLTREITIPKDMTQEEADYFAAWFKIWIALPKPIPPPTGEKPS